MKRRLTLLVCLLIAVASTWVYNESLAPLYRANTRILLESETRWLGFKDKNTVPVDWYITQFRILNSTPIITKVIERLNLTERYWYHPGPIQTLRAKLLGVKLNRHIPAADAASVIPRIRDSISVRPQTTTGLVNVSVVAPTGELASEIANALIETFMEENLLARINLSMAATDYLTQRLHKISARIQEREKAIEEFEEREGIDSFVNAVPVDSQQFTDFIDKYLTARSERWELEQRLVILEQLVGATNFEGISSPYLKETEVGNRSNELFDARLRLEKLENQGYMEKHPQVVAAKDDIETLKKRLMFASRARIAGLKSEIAALEQREKSVYDVLQKLRPDATLARKKRAQYAELQREIQIQQGFYDNYAKQLNRLQVVDDVSGTKIRVIEVATPPTVPFSPNKRHNLILALLMGTLTGLFLVFFAEYLDDTVKTADDIEEYLAMPTVGTIPRIRTGSGDGALRWRQDSASVVSEAYRTLRTNLQFFESEGPLRTILVTSPGPSEGKSTTAANVALTLVKMGKRVCLVDTDLRRPILHTLFQKSNRQGICSLFSGTADNKQKLLIKIEPDELYLLPCGPIPPNPSELLASKKMEEAMASLRKDFDYVIFDSPPVLAVTDAMVLSSMVDGVLLVIRSGESRIRLCQQALDSLTSIKSNVVGVVLNHISMKQHGYYSYYYQSEGRGYYRREPKSKKKAKPSETVTAGSD